MPVELQIGLALVRQRRPETALTLMKTTQPPELFSRSIRKIFELADDASPTRSTRSGPSSSTLSSRRS